MEGRLVAGRYAIRELIGEGGIARVYRAVDRLFGNEAAIKVLKRADFADVKSAEDEFLFASLNRHPGLTAPLSFITDDDQVMAVWPYIEGAVLRGERIKVVSDPGWLNFVLSSLLECAAFIHYSGHIYNDFKPDNVILVSGGDPGAAEYPRPLLVDYNLVSKAGEDVSKRGTIDYTAPEVLLGRSHGASADIYSLGVLIYELVVGKMPFEAANSDALIKAITETGSIGFSSVPGEFREGLEKMLDRRPESRPSDPRACAELLGLGRTFDKLYRQRVDYYLSAGPPPFHRELSESFEIYLGGEPCKAFWIKSLNYNNGALNYLAAKYQLRGYDIKRLANGADERPVQSILDGLEPGIREESKSKIMLMVDDASTLEVTAVSRLRALSERKDGPAVILASDRWTVPCLPAVVFDPLNNTTVKGATETCLKSMLKKDRIKSDFRALARHTSGDPPLVHLHLKYAALRTKANLSDGMLEADAPQAQLPHDLLSEAMDPIFDSLAARQIDMLRKLSAWGDSVPLLLLGILKTNEQAIIDELLASGHLIAEKDSVAFSSGDARDFIYYGLPVKKKKEYHRLWAEAADERLPDSDGYLEQSAIHWGESDNPEQGYKANLRAAAALLARGEISKAAAFGEKSEALAGQGGGSPADAAAVCAAIYKEAGDYKMARGKYLKLLRLLKSSDDKVVEARTYKELGDLYRSIKKTRKAVYYTNEALRLHESLHDDQGIADCNNNIGLTYWIDGQYEKALDSFQAAFEVNKKINNHRELAKIQSNRAIIKDMTGNTKEVAGYFLEAKEHAAEANDPRLLALISNNLGYFYIRQGEYEKAVVHLREAISSSEKIGYAEGVINALSNLGLCHLRSGDLFIAVDYNQKALETAEAIGSRHMAASAELYLTEACILMGNFSLAERVLSSIESGRAFAEDKSLKPQVDLLRSRLYSAAGLPEKASSLASGVFQEAKVIGDERLRLESMLHRARALSLSDRERAVELLTEVVEMTATLGHLDLATSAEIQLAELYFAAGDVFNGESWLERANAAVNRSKESRIKIKILEAEIARVGKDYDDSLEILYEVESIAAVSGFLPLALESSIALAGIFLECRKLPKARDTMERAHSYKSKLFAALPDYAAPATMERLPYIARIGEISREISNTEFMRT